MKSNILKRTLALAMSGMMILGLAACGNNKSDDSSASSNETANFSWFSSVTGWGPGNWNGTDTCPLLDALSADYGVSFTIEAPPTDADTKLGLMLATHDLPDLISLIDQDTIQQLIDSGEVWDMQTFLETYDPDSHLLTDFPEDIKATLTNLYGNWYSLPSHSFSNDNRELYVPCDDLYYEIANYASNGAIMFNATLMEELGITREDVQTEEAFYATLEKVKNSDYLVDGQSIIPLELHGDQWLSSSLNYVLSPNFGAVTVDENGDYRYIEQSPGYKNAMKFIQNCISRGYLDVNDLTIDETAMLTKVESGRVFCWIGNSAQSGTKNEIPWISYGPISASNGAVSVLGINQQSSTGWIQTLVSKDCKNPEALAKALSFATSREGLLLNLYGVEGEDYTVDEETGICTRTEAGEQRYVELYNSNMWLWPFNNTDFERSITAPAAEDTDEGCYNQIMIAMGTYETTYVFDSSVLDFAGSTILEPSSDLGIAFSQIESYLESQIAKIVTSATDQAFETEYNNMMQKLEDYGADAINAEYDIYLKQREEFYGTTIEDVNADLY